MLLVHVGLHHSGRFSLDLDPAQQELHLAVSGEFSLGYTFAKGSGALSSHRICLLSLQGYTIQMVKVNGQISYVVGAPRYQHAGRVVWFSQENGQWNLKSELSLKQVKGLRGCICTPEAESCTSPLAVPFVPDLGVQWLRVIVRVPYTRVPASMVCSYGFGVRTGDGAKEFVYGKGF